MRIQRTVMCLALLTLSALAWAGNDDAFFRLALFGSIAWAILGCGLTTLGAVMYNLISDVVGGVELIVLEETYLVPAPRTTPVRPAVHTPGNGGNDSTRPEPITTEPNAAITKTEPVATVEGS